MTGIRFADVALRRDQTTILRSVDFEIHRGEKVALVGASGAGKSSLFQLLTGEIKPTKGQVTVDNIELGSLTHDSRQTYRRHIGVVFQDFQLFTDQTVRENLAFALDICGYSKTEQTRKIENLLGLVGLEHRADNLTAQLSGGEKQRTAIARALIHDPEILIADEATGNLDPHNSQEVSELFNRLHREQEMTIFFSTHDPQMLQVMQPRVLRLENGILSQDWKTFPGIEAVFGV